MQKHLEEINKSLEIINSIRSVESKEDATFVLASNIIPTKNYTSFLNTTYLSTHSIYNAMHKVYSALQSRLSYIPTSIPKSLLSGLYNNSQHIAMGLMAGWIVYREYCIQALKDALKE